MNEVSPKGQQGVKILILKALMLGVLVIVNWKIGMISIMDDPIFISSHPCIPGLLG